MKSSIAQGEILVSRALPSRSIRTGVISAVAAATLFWVVDGVAGQESMEAKVDALIPRLEAYVQSGMAAYDNPGLAIGIVSGDRLLYAKGFGLKRKGGDPVDTSTVFQIGSVTKSFLATTMAIAVDHKEFAWDDRVVDLYPGFQMHDPWVTQEFRMFDLLAQRSGMPSYANDFLGVIGATDDQKIHSLRYVEPISSFRSTFAYTNITHLVAQRIVAKQADAPDWDTVVRTEIFEPLGMKDSSLTAEAIEAAPNRTWGYRWTPDGTVEVPFTPIFPYSFGAAGSINSTIEDLAHWVRLQLADGTYEGERIVSSENLAVTRMARVAITDKVVYAMGWFVQSTPNGTITFHGGATTAYGAYIGLARNQDVGVIVLTNESNVGFPDAVGEWTLDRLMGNPEVDHVAARLDGRKKATAAYAAMFAVPDDARPPPSLGSRSGTFSNPVFGEALLTEADGGLNITISSTGAKLRLTPWNGDVFVMTVPALPPLEAVSANLGPVPQAFAQFQTDTSGQLNLLSLSFPEYVQTYLFTRTK
jgi:CubicO group peptidase (beta-lactamase class C family)